MGIHQSIGRAGEPIYLVDMTRVSRIVRELEAEGRPVRRSIFLACRHATSIYFGCSIEQAWESEITCNGYRVEFILCGHIFAVTGLSCSDSDLPEFKHGRFLIRCDQRYVAFDVENLGPETRCARTESVDRDDPCAESRGGRFDHHFARAIRHGRDVGVGCPRFTGPLDERERPDRRRPPSHGQHHHDRYAGIDSDSGCRGDAAPSRRRRRDAVRRWWRRHQCRNRRSGIICRPHSASHR